MHTLTREAQRLENLRLAQAARERAQAKARRLLKQRAKPYAGSERA